MSAPVKATRPIDSLKLITRVPAGMTSIPSAPALVICSAVSETNRPCRSEMASQRCPGPQNLETPLLGVRPIVIRATAPRRCFDHFPLSPGRRVLPVRSCCIAACLMARFLTISRSSDAISPSTSDNAAAMARCSSTGGAGMSKLRIFCSVNRVMAFPLINSWSRCCPR